MGSFIYKDRLVYYHEFSEDVKNRKRIIILKSSGEFEYFKHNTASELGYYSSDGPAYNVMWMEYGMQEGKTVSNGPVDTAAEIAGLIEHLGESVMDFIIGDEEGAEIFGAFNEQYPDLTGKVYVPEAVRECFENAVKDNYKKADTVFFYYDKPENFSLRLRAAVYGLDKECPFCGGVMEMGYLYGAQSQPAYWTENISLVGSTNEFGLPEGVYPLRNRYSNKISLSEHLTGVSADDNARGYLCRKCGKMMLDMARMLVYYEDPVYLKENEGNIDPELARKSDKKESVLKRYLSSLGKSPEREETKPAKQKAKKSKYKGDEPAHRGFFGRGPKVE